MQIQYFGSIRAATQKSAEELTLSPGTSICHLLEHLADTYGEGLRGEILSGDDGKTLREDLSVSLNGTLIRREAAHETLLQPDDVLMLLPMFPGGG